MKYKYFISFRVFNKKMKEIGNGEGVSETNFKVNTNEDILTIKEEIKNKLEFDFKRKTIYSIQLIALSYLGSQKE